MNIPEDFNYEQDYKDLNYRFIKHISSDTKAKAIHVKVNNINYHVVTAPNSIKPTLSGYTATRTGKVENYQNRLFMEYGTDFNVGVKLLLNALNK
jgi:hypothetical protein